MHNHLTDPSSFIHVISSHLILDKQPDWYGSGKARLTLFHCTQDIKARTVEITSGSYAGFVWILVSL